ncbi:hypothetical protein L596_001457 [Steinernema carpocapsae]|uniref:Uncharacterized protein n=1 Tax=Steinernema carpocapsae TaxID=34508 RepID=A0A4U8UQB8_STECR|nr:hypothetical protein L596_001457 [Steinernema carpocapsae]
MVSHGMVILALLTIIIFERASAFLAPGVGSFMDENPDLKQIHGLNLLGRGGRHDSKLAKSIGSFTGQIVRMAKGGDEMSQHDVDNLVSSFTNLIVSIPGIERTFNVSYLRKEDVEKIFSGSYEVPGMNSENSQQLLQNFMRHMAKTALDLQNGRNVTDLDKVFLPYDKLPSSMMSNTIHGGKLPFLSLEESDAVKNYYMKYVINGMERNGAKDSVTLPPREKVHLPIYDPYANTLEGAEKQVAEARDRGKHFAFGGLIFLAAISMILVIYFLIKFKKAERAAQMSLPLHILERSRTSTFSLTPRSRKDSSYKQ